MILSVAQQQVVNVPESSWVGQMSMAGVGITILVLSAWCIKGRLRRGAEKGSTNPDDVVAMGPWGPLVVSIGDRLITESTQRVLNKWAKRKDMEGLDWKSLMTFTFGVFGMTAILSSSPGFVLTVMQWFQGMLMAVVNWPILSDLGAAFLCFVLVLLAMKSRDDDKRDLMYGMACGFIWPLGGGTFSEMTLYVGQWIPQILQIG